MSLSTKLAANFTKNVRKRGDDYHCKGRVMIHGGYQSELTACVRGSGFSEVQFAWRDNNVSARRSAEGSTIRFRTECSVTSQP